MVFGFDADMPVVWKMHVRLDRFLRADNPQAPRGYAVLGATV
jgi:hypothetical protein